MEFNFLNAAREAAFDLTPIFAKVCISTVLIFVLAFGFFYLLIENGARK